MSRTLIIGLPGAGKSTLAARLPGTLVSLDEIRQATSDGTPAGDYQARAIFLRACQDVPDGVFEFNGAGSHRHAVRLALSLLPAPLRTLYLRVPVAVARARVARRATVVPCPDYGVDPSLAFPRMVDILEADWRGGYWCDRPTSSAFVLDGDRPPEVVLQEWLGQ